jgi:hypothetical protein
VCTGENELIGSWKIMPMRLPRMAWIAAPSGAMVARSTGGLPSPVAEQDLAADDRQVRGSRLHQRERRHALARAALADQGQYLAAPHGTTRG